MEHKRIPGTDMQCSKIILGGVPLGSTLDSEASFRLLDAYADRGGNMIDTAQVYANWLPIEPSISEKTIGAWMKSRSNRSRLLVTTKGAHPLLHSMHIPRMTRAEIALDIEDSLKRLQTDVIDLYWLHRDATDVPAGEIMESLNEQVRRGTIRYFGCSNWTAQRIEEARKYAEDHRLQSFSGNQMLWSAAAVDSSKFSDPTLVAMDGGMHRFHRETGMAAIPYSSQANGLFTKWETGSYAPDDERISPLYRLDENRRRFDRIRTIAAEQSLTVTQTVLGFLLSQPFPTFPIVGCHTLQQLEESLQAAGVHLSGEQIAYLENGVR